MIVHLHSQRIHVSSQRDERRFSDADVANHAGHSDGVPVLDSDDVQLWSNEFAGLEFLVTQLRILVDLPSDSHHPIENLRSFREFEELLPELRCIAGGVWRFQWNVKWEEKLESQSEEQKVVEHSHVRKKKTVSCVINCLRHSINVVDTMPKSLAK